jgi:hypothetical protein
MPTFLFMLSKWLLGTEHWLSRIFNLIHSPRRASLGNCGGLVPFVLSVLWAPSALCGARPVITGHPGSFISIRLDCASWLLCRSPPPQLLGPPLDLRPYCRPWPSILFIRPGLLRWELWWIGPLCRFSSLGTVSIVRCSTCLYWASRFIHFLSTRLGVLITLLFPSFDFCCSTEILSTNLLLLSHCSCWCCRHESQGRFPRRS